MSDERVLKDVGIATAYGYAVAGGYTGTEEDFATLMASYADVAEQARESAEDSEAWAVGERDGVPVPDTDAQYHNNAKYYAEQAGTSAGESSDSAEASGASALVSEGHATGSQDGEPVEEGSPYYHNNALYYSQMSSQSADDADGFKRDAETAKRDAETAKTNAETAEGNAEAWAVGTKDSVPVTQSDPQYQNNAKYYAEQAQDAADASAAMTGLANQFDSTTAYAIGDYVLYDGTLYQFTASHPAGAWTGTGAVQSVLSDGVSDLKSQIEYIVEGTTIPNYNDVSFTPTQGKRITSSGVVEDTSATNMYVSSMITVTPLETYYITTRMNYYNYFIAWYDQNQTFLSGIGGNGTSTPVVYDLTPVVAPPNAKYLRIAWYIDTVNYPFPGTVKTLESYTNNLAGDVSKISDMLDTVVSETLTAQYTSLSFTEVQEKLINGNDGTLRDTTGTQYRVSNYIAVTGDVDYFITASSHWSNGIYAWYDSNYNTISVYKSASGSAQTKLNNEKVTAPSNASYLRIAYINPNEGIVKYISSYENVLSASVEDLENRVEALEEGQSQTATVQLVKSGNDLTFTDIASGMYLTAGLHDSDNAAFDFEKYFLSDDTTYKNAGDDICPIYYDRSYRCGNHGNYVAYLITSTSHGLTESDIGTVYTSANNIDYVIIRIVDTDKFWIVNDAATYTFDTTAPTSPLSNSGGSISFTSATLEQILPNINKITQSISVDGQAVNADGTYTGREIVVAEQYYSIDCLDMLAVLKANVGSNTNASYYGDTIDGDLIYATSYTIKKGLQVIVASKIITLRDSVNLTSWGITQSQAIGHRVFVPDSTDTGVWTQSAQTGYGTARWADADFPPYKVYQFDDSDNSKGIGIAYVLDNQNGIPATRKTLCPSMALNLAGTFKLYPFVVSMNVSNAKPKYTVYGGIAVRQPIALTNTLVIAYEIGKALYVEIDNLTDSVATVSVPGGHNGQAVDVLHRSENVSVIDTVLHDNAVTVIGKGSVSIKVA